MDFVSRSAFHLTQFGYREQVAARWQGFANGHCKQELLFLLPSWMPRKVAARWQGFANGHCKKECF
uniref:hypothetical protein n=1 Tax=Legionella wadsworthii TaxID=28088 RepID=UPI001054C664